MTLTQLTVKLKNEPGELSKISDILGDDGINIRAINASVHGKDARIHMVLDDTERAEEAMKSHGYETRKYEVVAVETPDHPGGLNAFLRPLKEEGINVEFLYPMIGRLKGNAIMVLGADPMPKAIKALERYYINIIGPEKVAAL